MKPYRFWNLLLFLLVIILLSGTSSKAEGIGGEVAYFKTIQMTPNVTHRQNVCDRYDSFRKGDIDIRDALKGMQLHAAVGTFGGSYFNYNETTGIDSDYPGLAAVLMDELARRGQFTWRDSFGIFSGPSSEYTWTELLQWTTEVYDVSVDWWGHSLERLNLGIAFPEGWLDSSLILITSINDDGNDNNTQMKFWNWTKPYDTQVWLMTISTILMSGLVYQVLEWQANERNDRTMWQWWQENCYLSFLNATQAYEFQPTTLASRIFGISMACWALVMTATYTANLASLLVDQTIRNIGPQTIEEVVVYKKPICVWEDTTSDTYLKDTFRSSAIRIRKPTILEVYHGLHTGECDFLVDSVANFKKLNGIPEYNPYCSLKWVGGPDRLIRGLLPKLIRDISVRA